MYLKLKSLPISILIITSFLATACGGQNEQDAAIQTAVAQTVQAQNAAQIQNTETPLPATAAASATPVAALPTVVNTPTAVPTLSSSSYVECGKASLTSETVVDGTIFKPGEAFTKTWQITNTSNCTWDTTYKIVFFSGDVLGGGYVYNLPRVVGPGQTVPIELVLTAPTAEGKYTSEWKLQTPDNYMFGVGAYNSPFYTKIEVSASATPAYSVTSLVTSVTRDPLSGCQPANITFTVYATVNTNGPLELTYYWDQSDGNNTGPKKVTIESAASKTFTREWKLGRAATQGTKWISFVVTAPNTVEQKQEFVFSCQ